jgi:hypothetical protein
VYPGWVRIVTRFEIIYNYVKLVSLFDRLLIRTITNSDDYLFGRLLIRTITNSIDYLFDRLLIRAITYSIDYLFDRLPIRTITYSIQEGFVKHHWFNAKWPFSDVPRH